MPSNHDSPFHEDLPSFLSAHAADLRTYLADLIRAQTVNPPGDEYRAAKVFTAFCDRHEIQYKKFEKLPGRTNIVARVGSGAPRIAVPVHFDTVPAGDGWTTDPFEAVFENGRMIGRGAKDNKGPMAGMMLAARYLKEHERTFTGQLIFVGAADEEAGSILGAKYLLEECGLEAEAAIVPDAGHNMRGIYVGEKGLLHFRVRAVGRQAHGSEPERGASAVWPMVDFLSAIRRWRPPAPPSDLFTPPTLNIGAIHAGSVPNMVPGQCECLVDIRYLPGTEGHAILDHVSGVLHDVEAASPGVRMELEVISHQLPSLVSPDHPMVAALERATEAVTGVRPVRLGMSGATVSKFFILRDIPAIGFSCGPEGAEHTADEWIDMDELGRFAEVMTQTLLDLFRGGQGA
jgi:acetylornithine deacetylase/succinyl-diaminopimelate desuccinylase family protein